MPVAFQDANSAVPPNGWSSILTTGGAAYYVRAKIQALEDESSDAV